MKKKTTNPIFKFLRWIAKNFTDKTEFITRCEVEPAPFIVTNHTGISAPAMFLIHYPLPLRTWSHASFLNVSLAWQHLKNNVLKRRKTKILFPLAFIFSPIIVWFYHIINPIPVYKESKKIVQTFEESYISKSNNITQIIFPEKLDNNVEQVNKYLFKFNRGFVYSAKYYYEKTGKILKFYPAYSCPSLNKVVIGEPIAYNPDVPFKIMRENICTYLENKIYALAESLPSHDVVLPIQ